MVSFIEVQFFFRVFCRGLVFIQKLDVLFLKHSPLGAGGFDVQEREISNHGRSQDDVNDILEVGRFVVPVFCPVLQRLSSH